MTAETTSIAEILLLVLISGGIAFTVSMAIQSIINYLRSTRS